MREKILFVELWRLGDAVSATAGLRALRKARPDAEIGVAAHSIHGDPLLRSSDANVKLPFDAFWTRGKFARDKYLPWTIDYRETARLARRVLDFGPDHIMLFRGDIRERVFFSMLAPRRVSDLSSRHPRVPGCTIYERPKNVSRWREYVSHVRQWSGTDVDATPSIECSTVSELPEDAIVLHPGAGWSYRQWGASRFAALFVQLRRRGFNPRIVAGRGERTFVRSILDGIDGLSEDDVLYPTIDGLYAALANARAVICNNSSALHIAQAFDVPCLALTGPSDPVRWGTYRENSFNLGWSMTLPCHPCGERRCIRPHAPCMELIEVNHVIDALHRLGIRADSNTSTILS